MALCEAGLEAVYLRAMSASMGYAMRGATLIFGDDQAASAMATTPNHNRRTKHINVRYHKIRELIRDGLIQLAWVPTTEQLADMFTKGLPKPTLDYLREVLVGMFGRGGNGEQADWPRRPAPSPHRMAEWVADGIAPWIPDRGTEDGA